MKKAVLFLGLALSVGNFVASCSSDRDSEVVSNRYNVVGKWEFSEYYYENSWKSMSILEQYIELKEDGSYSTNYLGYNDSGTYTYNGKDLVITKSKDYGDTHIRIKSMNDTSAEVELFEPTNPNEYISFRLKKR